MIFDLSSLDIINCHVCAQSQAWQGHVGEHLVHWEKAPPGYPYEMHYVCDCLGFKYRHKCKHLKVADLMRCHWGEGAFSGSPSNPSADGTCPECGGPTVMVRVKI